jgi:cell division protein FtsQ
MTGTRRWRLVRAPAQAIPASVRRFNQRARQRRLRALVPWLAAVVVAAVVGLVILVMYGTPLFGVGTIEVRGSSIATADQVRAAAGVSHGTPLARLDLTAISQRVGTLTPVRAAVVTRDWPSTVVIQVTERSPVAALARPDKRFSLIDAAGVVFHTVSSRPPGLPMVALGRPGPTDPSTRAGLEVLAALTGELRADLGTLVAQSPTRISLNLRDGRRIIWGDATQNTAKARVATTLLARDGTVIDVSAPTMVTVN